MIRRLAIVLALSGPAAAETARVYSGEHESFTRLVVEVPVETEWTVGRTNTGYAFAVGKGAQPDYDLSGVWQRITRTRVAALQVDPATGALLVTLGCDCHVFPFEYRPGSIVLDIKSGPPPAGSEFERALADRLILQPDVEPERVSTDVAVYDWRSDLPSSSLRPRVTLPLPLQTGEVSLDPLRNALLEQIARGAAEGLVDMSLSLPKGLEGSSSPEILPWSTVMLGEQPGIKVSDPDAFRTGAEPAGRCPEDELLDIASWGGDGTPLDLLAAARAGLYGEFDVANPEAVLRSVRAHLYLGFGAEAVQLTGLVEPDDNAEVMAFYRSMARVLDRETDPGTPFAMMLDCDGQASLWAALARDRLPTGKGVNREAVLRSFLALPAHLRADLGSGLAEKFLVLDDVEAVRTIRDAMERTPNINTAAVALLDAERELHQGNPDAAQAHAETVVSEEGNSADGYIALVEAHFQKLAPIGPEVAEALIAGQGEAGDPELADRLERAIVLSLALSGRIDEAFQREVVVDATLSDLWKIIQTSARDDDFLRYAVLPAHELPAKVAADLRLQIARRLLSLGFPDAAIVWAGPVQRDDTPERRLVAAEASLGLGDARSTKELLAGLAGPEAAELRAEALLELGDLAEAEEMFAAMGQTEAASRANLWNGEWTELDSTTPEVWRTAADLVQPKESGAATGLLARGAEVVDASVTSRTAIETLLNTVVRPETD